jgi:SAM-dependent methyltransferase
MGSAEVQGEVWGLRVREWSELQEPQVRPLYDAVLDNAGIDLGTDLLDAACGAGLALAMAEGRGANPHGVDASAAMLEVARERLARADLRQGDIEELPFEDDRFDAVTCFNGLQFAEDRARALGELRRVAVPGGVVTVAVWAEAERNDMRVVLAALASLLPERPPEDSGPFALSGPGELERLMEQAGLRPELDADVACPFRYRDETEALSGLMSAGPLAMAAKTLGEQQVAATVASAIERFRRDDGSYRLDNWFRYVLARA